MLKIAEVVAAQITVALKEEASDLEEVMWAGEKRSKIPDLVAKLFPNP